MNVKEVGHRNWGGEDVLLWSMTVRPRYLARQEKSREQKKRDIFIFISGKAFSENGGVQKNIYSEEERV